MRWTLQELLLEMEQDSTRRILFVEGTRDLAFWRDLFGIERRDSTVVYPIGTLDCAPGEGGERGRLIRTAILFQGSPVAQRVRFFTDADVDRLLGRVLPDNVFLTDGRDLECYGLSANCLDHICQTAFPGSRETGSTLLDLVRRVARPIGLLRVTSEKGGYHLPFQHTLRRGMGRFLVTVDGVPQLDLIRLVRVLIQNSVHGLSIRDEVVLKYENEVQDLQGVADNQVIHGKDFTSVLAWRFDVSMQEIERLVFMSVALEVEQVQQLETIRATQAWLKL